MRNALTATAFFIWLAATIACQPFNFLIRMLRQRVRMAAYRKAHSGWIIGETPL